MIMLAVNVLRLSFSGSVELPGVIAQHCAGEHNGPDLQRFICYLQPDLAFGPEAAHLLQLVLGRHSQQLPRLPGRQGSSFPLTQHQRARPRTRS